MLLLDDAVEHCGYGLDFVEGEAEFHRLFINAVVCLNGEDGIEAPNRNVKAYAEALKKLAADEDMRKKMGAAGKKRVEDNFLNTQFKGNILRVIDGV